MYLKWTARVSPKGVRLKKREFTDFYSDSFVNCCSRVMQNLNASIHHFYRVGLINQLKNAKKNKKKSKTCAPQDPWMPIRLNAAKPDACRSYKCAKLHLK